MQDPSPEKIGQNLRERRITAGLSQQVLATKAGVASRTVARIEAGEDVRLGTLSLLAAALDLTVSDLVEPIPVASSPTTGETD